MTVIDSYLKNPRSRWRHFRLWLAVSAWPAVRDWCLRWIYAQHNARVLADMESRMVSVIYAATNGMMSKPYYTKEAMLEQITAAHGAAYDDAYADGRSDLADELGVTDPSPPSKENN